MLTKGQSATKRRPAEAHSASERVRLHKAIAAAGISSRRQAEALIRSGRVSVNGHVVREMGVQVDPGHDEIRVNGQILQAAQKHTYLMLHKPGHVVTTVSDPEGRQTVMDFIPRERRLFPVGRLDFDSEGLVLLTDDGALANRLMHPRYEHEREYIVLAKGRVANEAIDRLRAGVDLDEGRTAPARVQLIEHVTGDTRLRIVLREGRKRQIRQMLKKVGHPVRRLVRVRIGSLLLGDLPVGQWRTLTPHEVRQLKRGVESRA